MCKVLQISRSTYYYEAKQKPDENNLVTNIINIFKSITMEPERLR